MRSVRAALAAVLFTTVLATASSGAASQSVPTGCTRSDVTTAAKTLIHPAAEVLSFDRVAGFHSALVSKPVMYPGVRHRLVEANGLWCDGLAGFNAAWRTANRRIDAVAIASAYAAVAPAPWFDEVQIEHVGQTTPGLVSLVTHARTNGIVARWTVVVDPDGVRRATWTATAFARPPFEASWEGLTALPGAKRTFTRGLDGLLKDTAPMFDPGPVETLQAEVVAEDGFIIEIRNGDTPLGVTLDHDTGDDTIDFLRITRDAAEHNYTDFLEWGLQKGWTPSDRGQIRVDSALTAFCIACVLYSQSFNIHMSSQAVRLLGELGYRYPDHRLAISDVIGHEMFHNFQNVYSGADVLNDRRMSIAYSEGIARMQETLHDYAHVSHQPESLVYADDSNGCNGYLRSPEGNDDTAKALANRFYEACYFWMAFYADHGIDGLVGVVDASSDHVTSGNFHELVGVIEDATGRSVPDVLADFAFHALTATGYTWGAADGSSAALDWATHLDRWSPAPLELGDEINRVVESGGMIAAQLFESGVVHLAATEEDIALYRMTPSSTPVRVFDGDTIDGPGCVPGSETSDPGPGTGQGVGSCQLEPLWLVAVLYSPNTAEVTLGLS